MHAYNKCKLSDYTSWCIVLLPAPVLPKIGFSNLEKREEFNFSPDRFPRLRIDWFVELDSSEIEFVFCGGLYLDFIGTPSINLVPGGIHFRKRF